MPLRALVSPSEALGRSHPTHPLTCYFRRLRSLYDGRAGCAGCVRGLYTTRNAKTCLLTRYKAHTHPARQHRAYPRVHPNAPSTAKVRWPHMAPARGVTCDTRAPCKPAPALAIPPTRLPLCRWRASAVNSRAISLRSTGTQPRDPGHPTSPYGAMRSQGHSDRCAPAHPSRRSNRRNRSRQPTVRAADCQRTRATQTTFGHPCLRHAYGGI